MSWRFDDKNVKNNHILPQNFDEDDVRDDELDDWSMLEGITQSKLSKNMLFICIVLSLFEFTTMKS
jgi:hypothetical protein